MTRTFICFLMILTPSLLSAGELLRWKFDEGQTFDVEVMQSTSTTTEVNGKSIEMVIDMTMQMNWHVDSVEDGTATMTQSITRLSMKAKAPGSDEVVFDSASEEKEVTGRAKQIADSVRPIVGAAYSLEMTDRGEIRNVSVSDDTQKLLEQSASKKTAALFSRDSIEKTLQQVAIRLPKEVVESGTMWEQISASKTSLGDVKQATTFTYSGLDSDSESHAINATTKIELAAGSRSTLKEQSSNGTITFNNDAGYLTSSNFKQQLVAESTYRETKILVTTTTNAKATVSQK